MDLADLVAAVKRIVQSLLRERLVHFAALGLLLFAVCPRSQDSARVSLPGDYLRSLHAAQAHRLGVPALSETGAAEVDRRAIEDEVLYREALRLGLDRDDAIVRQHLIQKVLLLAEDLAGASRDPSEAEVRAYFERTRDRWRMAETVHLIHVFATRRETLLALRDAVVAAGQDHPGVPPALGDAFPRSRDVRGSRQDLAASYGDEFAGAVMALPAGAWSDPVPSRFGWHLVQVVEHSEGRPATLAEVFARVRLEYAVEQRHQAIARFISQAMARYQVDVDGAPVRGGEPTKRLAMRSAPSGED